MESLSDSFREAERILDNFISEGQMLQSRFYEIKLKAESQKAYGVVTSGLIAEGIKHFIGIPKKYVAPFMKKKSIDLDVDNALEGGYRDWFDRLNQFLETVSVYSPSIKTLNSTGYDNTVANSKEFKTISLT